MPTSLAIILGIAAALTALATIWRLLIRPTAELIVLQQSALPLLRKLVLVFGDDDNTFDVLDEIAAQFRTNGGSSLRDVVNRLDTAAVSNAAAADVLKVQVEAARLLGVQDREQVARLMLMIDRLAIKVDAGDVQQNRMEAATSHVADELARSQGRADAITGTAGEAADAASRSGER